MGWKVWDWNPRRDKGFFLGSTQQLLQWVLGFFPGFKAGYDIDQSPPSRAEVKNEWSCSSTPLICIHGTDRGSLTSYALLMMLLIVETYSVKW
jgi:hypothetical protein